METHTCLFCDPIPFLMVECVLFDSGVFGLLHQLPHELSSFSRPKIFHFLSAFKPSLALPRRSSDYKSPIRNIPSRSLLSLSEAADRNMQSQHVAWLSPSLGLTNSFINHTQLPVSWASQNRGEI